MKHHYGRIELPVDRPSAAVRFYRSRAGAFFLGFFLCGLLCGLLSGLLPYSL